MISRMHMNLSSQLSDEACGETIRKMLLATTKLRDEILRGCRSALARGITLVESTREDHRAQAQLMVSSLLRRDLESSNPVKFPKAFRVGLTGAPVSLFFF